MRIVDNLHEDSQLLGFNYNIYKNEFWGFDENQNIRLTDFKEINNRFLKQNQVFKTNFQDYHSWDKVLFEKINFFNNRKDMN